MLILINKIIECGYYDNTDLIKDFKTLTGNTPDNILRLKKSRFFTQ